MIWTEKVKYEVEEIPTEIAQGIDMVLRDLYAFRLDPSTRIDYDAPGYLYLSPVAINGRKVNNWITEDVAPEGEPPEYRDRQLQLAVHVDAIVSFHDAELD